MVSSMNIKRAAQIWSLSERRVNELCKTGRIEGAHKEDGEISTPWIEQKCPFCGAKLKYVDHDLDKGRDFWFCVICDTYLTYFWEGSRWERGKIED